MCFLVVWSVCKNIMISIILKKKHGNIHETIIRYTLIIQARFMENKPVPVSRLGID